VGHIGVSVLTHTDCLNSDSQHQPSDTHVVPSALVHRAFCDLESIHDRLESLKSLRGMMHKAAVADTLLLVTLL
jgi:hypothetical protein